jgi:hypothetical protein
VKGATMTLFLKFAVVGLLIGVAIAFLMLALVK